MKNTKELFEKQLIDAHQLTEEVLGKLKQKTYFNGEEKQVGDVVLYAMLIDEIVKKNGEYSDLSFKLITLNERHFDMFEFVDQYNYRSVIPSIKLKDKLNELKYSDYLLDKIIDLGGFEKLSMEEREWLTNFNKKLVIDFHIEEINKNKPKLGYDKLGHLTIDDIPIDQYNKIEDEKIKMQERGINVNDTNEVRIYKYFGNKTKFFYAYNVVNNVKYIFRMSKDIKNGGVFIKPNIYDNLNKINFFNKINEKYDYFIILKQPDADRFIKMVEQMKQNGNKDDIKRDFKYFDELI